MLRVTYDDRSCNEESPPVAACKLLLRFVDSSGNAVPGVRVQSSNSDDFGRLLIRFAAGTTWNATATAPGLRPATLTFSCTPGDYWLERFVTLVRE